MTIETFDLHGLSETDLYHLKEKIKTYPTWRQYERYHNELLLKPLPWFIKDNNFYYLQDGDITFYDISDMIMFTHYFDEKTRQHYNFISLYNIWMIYLVVNDLAQHVHMENYRRIWVT